MVKFVYPWRAYLRVNMLFYHFELFIFLFSFHYFIQFRSHCCAVVVAMRASHIPFHACSNKENPLKGVLIFSCVNKFSMFSKRLFVTGRKDERTRMLCIWKFNIPLCLRMVGGKSWKAYLKNLENKFETKLLKQLTLHIPTQ